MTSSPWQQEDTGSNRGYRFEPWIPIRIEDTDSNREYRFESRTPIRIEGTDSNRGDTPTNRFGEYEAARDDRKGPESKLPSVYLLAGATG